MFPVIFVLFIAFVPLTSADTPPVLLWPPAELVEKAEASNLTQWFADGLGVQIDDYGDGAWHPVNEQGRPEFLWSDEAYVLPLVDGEIEVRYNRGGVLRTIILDVNTSYLAESVEEASLRATIEEVATALGLDATGAVMNVEVMIHNPGTPQEVRQWRVELVKNPEVGMAMFLNRISLVVLEPELRVISVVADVWYELPEDLNADAANAVVAAEGHARSEHRATNASGAVLGVTVLDQEGFAFLVYTSWPEDRESSWALQTWVDGSTGEVLFEDGPNLTTVDIVPPPDRLPWLPIIVTGALVVLVTIGLFYRLTAERAMDHFTRGRILGYVQAYPGSKYTSIREALGLTNGTLAYHLWVLERLGFVRSIRQGRVRLLHPRGRPITQHSLVLSQLQYTILDLLKAEGHLSQSEISRSLNLSRQRVHYNVKKLRSLYLIKVTADRKLSLSQRGTEIVEDVGNARNENSNTVLPSRV
jgi:DNA-binding MarR family transcriptional regulator